MELNVTNKSKSANFEGIEGNYNLSGTYFSRNAGELSEIQGGMVRKAEAIIGNYYAHIENAKLKFTISNMDLEEMVVVAPLLNTLAEAIVAQLDD